MNVDRVAHSIIVISTSGRQASVLQTPLRAPTGATSAAPYPTPNSNERPPRRAEGSPLTTSPTSPSPASRFLSHPLSLASSIRPSLSRQFTLPDVLSPTLLDAPLLSRHGSPGSPLSRHGTAPALLSGHATTPTSLGRRMSIRAVLSRRSTQRSLSRAVSLRSVTRQPTLGSDDATTGPSSVSFV